MISTQPIIYCTNPECSSPINSIGNTFCAECQTPLIKNFLWATGSNAAQIEAGEMIKNRYEVISPQVWLDSQPVKLPDIPEKFPDAISPYLKLYRQRLHLPQVYGYVDAPKADEEKILLLENVPVDEVGNLYPNITDVWQQGTATRQVYWLWQILQLWQPLEELGVAASLFVPGNLRVQGWCVRLLELFEDLPTNLQEVTESTQQSKQTTKWQKLGDLWQPWLTGAKYPIAKPLCSIVEQMVSDTADFEVIENKLNELLLSSAGELPLTVNVAGVTDVGSELTKNEDSCFPCRDRTNNHIDNALSLQVSIVCDGIGGHEGGEVASTLALQSMLLQVRAFIAEISTQAELDPPKLLQEQLEASLRVVNNLICASNNRQNRSARERMATTLVMGVQVPQSVNTVSDWRSENAHELYIVNVGDSRAYWITKEHCRLLTTDDDVTAREVESDRSLYHQALTRTDALALTQALGTKEGKFLHPRVQRIIIEEDGLLLLCSDGLSDISSGGRQSHHNWIEYSWRTYALPVLSGEITLDRAAQSWVELANQKNGHDNTSIVLTYYRVSPEYPIQSTESIYMELNQQELAQKELTEKELAENQITSEPSTPSKQENFTESSQALLDLENMVVPVSSTNTSNGSVSKSKKGLSWLLPVGVFIFLLAGTACGLFIWWRINPSSFNRNCMKLPKQIQQICPEE
ncbi:MAG: protein phosphatase 2C domain-containing protein [Cyanobacteria bacterium P01_A01_bin.45]